MIIYNIELKFQNKQGMDLINTENIEQTQNAKNDDESNDIQEPHHSQGEESADSMHTEKNQIQPTVKHHRSKSNKIAPEPEVAPKPRKHIYPERSRERPNLDMLHGNRKPVKIKCHFCNKQTETYVKFVTSK